MHVQCTSPPSPASRATRPAVPLTHSNTQQDTLAGYAAVFSAMVRVRRVEQLLRSLHAPLAARPTSTADLLLR